MTIDKNDSDENQKSIPDLLLEWINDNGPDYVVLGADGARCQREQGSAGVHRLGSTCEIVVRESKCQVLVTWPKSE